MVPSITDLFLEAFVFENEIHDLFGVDIKDIAIDFGGISTSWRRRPMTVISPEQLAARAEGEEDRRGQGRQGGEGRPRRQLAHRGEIQAKIAGLDPEKAAKVRAAMEAKAKKHGCSAPAAPRKRRSRRR